MVEVINNLMPNGKDQIEEMREPGPPGPIYMVNLLKFKDHAVYEDRRQTNLTGREAYQLYSDGVRKLLAEVGGQIVFSGSVTFLAIGQIEDLWDEIAIAMYPSRADLLEMSSSSAWREIGVHRAAGLAGQLNIETVASMVGF